MTLTDDQRKILIAKLNAELQAGIDQLDRGEGIDGETFFAELKRERKARVAKPGSDERKAG